MILKFYIFLCFKLRHLGQKCIHQTLILVGIFAVTLKTSNFTMKLLICNMKIFYELDMVMPTTVLDSSMS